jgi:hypothetical protein
MNAPRDPDPLYYLRNFATALRWLSEHYADLLSDYESTFLTQFGMLPECSQALLVRLVMRRGDCFRRSKIVYPEIGCIETAVAPLAALAWIDATPKLTAAELFRLLRRDELALLFPDHCKAATKVELLSEVDVLHPEPRTLEAWRVPLDERAYRVLIAPLCTQLRLLFFGSFHQDWSEFVLTELGIFKYETLDLSADTRAFQTRADIEAFFRLYECRERLHNDVPAEEILDRFPDTPFGNEWLEARRAKLLFQAAHQLERRGQIPAALATYRQSSYPDAIVRAIRVMERNGLYAEALTAAQHALSCARSPTIDCPLERVLRRIRRRWTGERQSRIRHGDATRRELELPLSDEPVSVEELCVVTSTRLGHLPSTSRTHSSILCLGCCSGKLSLRRFVVPSFIDSIQRPSTC